MHTAARRRARSQHGGGPSASRDARTVPGVQHPSTRDGFTFEQADANLAALSSADLIDISANARAVGFAVVGDSLDALVTPRGYRLLSKVPRLPGAIIERLVDNFGSLQALLGAEFDDLLQVDGVGESRARAVREGLSRLAESSILERYV